MKREMDQGKVLTREAENTQELSEQIVVHPAIAICLLQMEKLMQDLVTWTTVASGKENACIAQVATSVPFAALWAGGTQTSTSLQEGWTEGRPGLAAAQHSALLCLGCSAPICSQRSQLLARGITKPLPLRCGSQGGWGRAENSPQHLGGAKEKGCCPHPKQSSGTKSWSPWLVSFPENEKRERGMGRERNPAENPRALALTGLSCKFPICEQQRAPGRPWCRGCPCASA